MVNQRSVFAESIPSWKEMHLVAPV